MVRRVRAAAVPRPLCRGVVLLALLLVMALMGLALMSTVEVSATAGQREREQELLFVGDQYRQAIERYYWAAPPGRPRTLPAGVAQLLLDDRYPQPVQHLRRAYEDPFGEPEWGLVRIGGRLAGVRSVAAVAPIKRANFPERYAAFAEASEVSQWIFLFKPPPAVVPTPRPTR
ncbi:MAG: type II secretion system protein [Rubrivivax sp.]|nr:type II secretion system protein [Rubrivivax sp.]